MFFAHCCLNDVLWEEDSLSTESTNNNYLVVINKTLQKIYIQLKRTCAALVHLQEMAEKKRESLGILSKKQDGKKII